MLGWEFPPYISGGLGTACRGLTDALRRQHARVLFVLPRAVESAAQETSKHRLIDPSSGTVADMRLVPIPSELTTPYPSVSPRHDLDSTNAEREAMDTGVETPRAQSSSVRVIGVGSEDGYDGDLVRKIRDFTERCMRLARKEIFDVIHAHDWMTYPAAEGIARLSGRPMVVHVHATEFDRSGDEINPVIFEMERRGMMAASRVLAVSRRTRDMIIAHYGVDPDKVMVIHNGVERDETDAPPADRTSTEKTVLFLGRVTRQKGPEYFARACARVAQRIDDVRFLIGGTGDLVPRVKELVANLGIGDKVEFLGFLGAEDVKLAYRRADVFVMPSVSEPFGLTALEAVQCGVPVVVSTSSGAAEVLPRGSLKVDFWDTELMAQMIAAVLTYPSLANTLRRRAAAEIAGLTWDTAAARCIRIYHDVIEGVPTRAPVLVTELASRPVEEHPAACATN